MKPHSIEFRQKIIEVHKKESLSIRKLAQRFCVAKSFIQKLLKQYKETGDIHPQPQGGSSEPKLKQEQLIDLVEIIETHFVTGLLIVVTVPHDYEKCYRFLLLFLPWFIADSFYVVERFMNEGVNFYLEAFTVRIATNLRTVVASVHSQFDESLTLGCHDDFLSLALSSW